MTSSFVTEATSFNTTLGSYTKNYYDTASANVTTRAHATYEGLRSFKEGEAVICYGDKTTDVRVYFSNPGFAKAMRVSRFMSLPPPSETLLRHVGDITKLRDLMVKKGWTAAKADVASPIPEELLGAINGFKKGNAYFRNPVEAAIVAVAGAYAAVNPVDMDAPPVSIIPAAVIDAVAQQDSSAVETAAASPASPAATPPAPAVTQPVATNPINPFSGFATKPPQQSADDQIAAVLPGPEPVSESLPAMPLVKINPDITKILEDAASDARDILVESNAAE